MKLLFEIGNSQIKWAYNKDGRLIKGGQFINSPDQFYRHLKMIAAHITNPIDGVAVSSVLDAATTMQFNKTIHRLWGIDPWSPEVKKTAAGLCNAYHRPDRLGIDRWLAIIAAWHTTHQASCIIDCGSALTLDLVDGNGQHQGGYILPGLGMMQDTVIQNTAKVHAHSHRQFSLQPGQDTQSCVSNGCATAIIGFLEHILAANTSRLGCPPTCLLTGADAEYIAPYLSLPYQLDDLLILKGLTILWEDSP